MVCCELINKKIKKMDWIDIALTKLAVFAFALLIANRWEVIIKYPWYLYVIIFVLAAIRPMIKIFGK